MTDFLENFSFQTLYTGAVRWVFIALALYILVRAILSLIRANNPAEVWAYIHIKTYGQDRYGAWDVISEESLPITHWENVIGRAKSSDIVAKDLALSRNHGILMRDAIGQDSIWRYRDLGSRNGTYINDVLVSREGEMGPAIRLEYGDVIRAGQTEFTLLPISLEERANNLAMRKSDTRVMSAGPSLAALTLFQILTVWQLWLAIGTEYLAGLLIAFGGLSACMWIYMALLGAFARNAVEMETIAFFLSTLNLAVVATSAPDKLPRQLIAIALGIFVMLIMCILLRNLERAKVLRYVMFIGAVLLLIANLTIGTFGFGAKNWISIGTMTFQPSELVKVAFVWIGAATLDELFQKKNLWIFMGFSAFCFGCLGLMGDFGTAIIFFVTFLIISFLRSGDFSKLFLMAGAAAAGGFIILQFKPYVAARFQTWGHIWDAEVVNAAGYQQTRTLSAAASGGLTGCGAGNGWLESLPAADTDMVFGILIEEWGLIIALLAVLSIVTLAIFAVRSIMAGRSTYYTIAACGAMSMFIFQTMLNIFGCTDILPFTGVTFPFVSNGGTSMIVSWALLAFLKSADTRENASLAVKGGALKGSAAKGSAAKEGAAKGGRSQ